MADLLAADGLDPRQRGFVEAIRASGRHLLSIINDILDFSRIEAGGLALERVDFSLAEVLEQVRSLMAPLAVERGLGLSLEYGGGGAPAGGGGAPPPPRGGGHPPRRRRQKSPRGGGGGAGG